MSKIYVRKERKRVSVFTEKEYGRLPQTEKELGEIEILSEKDTLTFLREGTEFKSNWAFFTVKNSIVVVSHFGDVSNVTKKSPRSTRKYRVVHKVVEKLLRKCSPQYLKSIIDDVMAGIKPSDNRIQTLDDVEF